MRKIAFQNFHRRKKSFLNRVNFTKLTVFSEFSDEKNLKSKFSKFRYIEKIFPRIKYTFFFFSKFVQVLLFYKRDMRQTLSSDY